MNARTLHTFIVFIVTFTAAALFSGAQTSLFNQCFADGSSEEAEAIFQQAQSLLDEYGVPEDEEKAVELYRQAAELGHPKAQFTYGSCFFDGEIGRAHV